MDTQRNYEVKFALLQETTPPRICYKKCVWISISVLTVVIGVFSAFYYWKIFIASYEKQNYFSFLENTSTESPSTLSKNSTLNLFIKKIWEPSAENCLELVYPDVELQNFVSASFNIYSREKLKILLTNVYGYMNMDLILYYEKIINKYTSKELKEIFENFKKELRDSSNILEFISKIELEKFKFYVKYLNENNIKAEKKYFTKFIKLTDELRDWYVYLENLSNYLYRYEQQKVRKDYYKNISEKNFLKFTNETQKITQGVTNTFNVTEKKLNELNKIIREWMSPPNTTLENSMILINNKVLLISEVKNHIKLLNTSSLKRLYIFASHTVYLDEDLTLPGIDVVIIAPKWIFLKKIKINLDGRGGKEFLEKTATEGNVGKPGTPGENSGDFVGIGELNKNFLILSVNGGKGGDGQNGARGRDGVNNTCPRPPIGTPLCVDKLGNFKNPFGQIITHYKIFNEAGCGSFGTDGGARGTGGKSGTVVIVNTEDMLITKRSGIDGLNGSDGEGGEGGMGGQNGCYYEVFDVDDKILHSVTTTKCQFNVLPSGKPGKKGANKIGQILPPLKEHLRVFDCLYAFYKSLKQDLMEFNDMVVTSFLQKLIKDVPINNSSNILMEYDILEKFSRNDLLQVLGGKINALLPKSPKDNFLYFVKALILGKILSLQTNKNYYFLDIDYYLSVREKNIKNLSKNLTSYSLSKISKSVEMKLEKISKNLKFLKLELTVLETKRSQSAKKFLTSTNVNSNFSKSLVPLLEERRILYITQMLADLMIHLVTLIQNPSFSNKEFKNFLARHSLYYNEMQRKKEKIFDSANDLSSREKQILSQIVIKPGEFEEHSEILLKVSDFVTDGLIDEKKLVKIWEHFSDEKRFVKGIRDVAESFSESKALSIEGLIVLQAFTDELDHFMALHYYIEREKMEKSFLKSLNNFKFISEDFRSEHNQLKNVLILIEYNLAVDAVQLKVQPFKKLEKVHISSSNLADEALLNINQMRIISKQNAICKNFREGIFDKTSVLGDFYHWTSLQIRNKLRELFTGKAISLKSSLNNRHLMDKNFIKFKTLKLEFDSRNPSLLKVLNNFQIEMIHSGYSYYNWGGEKYVVISEEVTLVYGFKTNINGEPQVYNTLYKKLQSGEFMLSPYTTWTVRLSAINNKANFNQLTPFVNNTDLRLIGTGTFIS